MHPYVVARVPAEPSGQMGIGADGGDRRCQITVGELFRQHEEAVPRQFRQRAVRIDDRRQGMGHAVEHGPRRLPPGKAAQLDRGVRGRQILVVEFGGDEARDANTGSTILSRHPLPHPGGVSAGRILAGKHQMAARITRQIAGEPGFQEPVIELDRPHHPERADDKVLRRKAKR